VTSTTALPTPAIPAPPVGADEVFAQPLPRIDDFDFGARTAAVFDDMLDRSVPFYGEIQRMSAELAVDFVLPHSSIVDLGCSTGATLLEIDRLLPADIDATLVGLDSSPEMLAKARAKFEQRAVVRPYTLCAADFNRGVSVADASVVLMILTLQFVRPICRDALLAAIYRDMQPHGCLIVVEKVLGEHSIYNRLFIKHYYALKRRRGYSDLEIAQKREALENVLIPYRLEENRELLKRAGFEQIDVFFKWYNFCGLIATK
jgi:tRNA (cmo5U34)-methyltransferase